MGTHATSEGHRQGLRKGAWTAEEDALLIKCMEKYVVARWSLIPKLAVLNRCPKSCRLRWLNYLCPSIKRGKFEDDEVDLIIRLHKLLGNRWSLIAGRIPGRTANDVKNYWNTHLSKQLVIEKDEKQASARYVEVIEPQPQAIPWNWISTTDDEADQVMHKELNIPKQPLCSNNNTTCTGNIIDTETVNFSMAHNEVEMMQEPQIKFGSEDIGGSEDIEFLLEGFGGREDMNGDINVWGDFRPI